MIIKTVDKAIKPYQKFTISPSRLINLHKQHNLAEFLSAIVEDGGEDV